MVFSMKIMRIKRGNKQILLHSDNPKKKLISKCSKCCKCYRPECAKDKQNPKRELKALCKSPRCFIHNGPGKVKKKFEERIPLSELLKKINSAGICRVIEFEESTNEEVEINVATFYTVKSVIVDINWDDIKFENVLGYDATKEAISRTVIWPLNKPKLFKGLRTAPKAILLFGPLGAGKSIIGKNIAFQTDATFFNLPAPFLMSRWMENSRDFMRALFEVAKARQPSVIFIDEVERVFGNTTYYDNETTRKIKNDLLYYMDGAEREVGDRILVIGTTKKPFDLDEEFIRRFPKRFYISLPDKAARKRLVEKLLECECHSLEDLDIEQVADKTEGYTVAEIKHLSKEAAMGPMMSLPDENYENLDLSSIKPISAEDFLCALRMVKPSISKEDLQVYEKWDVEFGYGGQWARKTGKWNALRSIKFGHQSTYII